MLTFAVPKHRGVEQLVARRAHNPEAGGSSPSPATIYRGFLKGNPLFLLYLQKQVYDDYLGASYI